MPNLLVPIDGSDAARRALDHAIAQCRDRPGSRLHLVNVQTPPVHPFPGKLVSPDMIDQELRHEGEAMLEPFAGTARAAGLPCQLHVHVGRQPAEAICTIAASNACDQIVMGTRGMGRVAGLLLGSVATQVVHHAAMPVTLVK